MKTVFRIRYQTVPGQSLWLLLEGPASTQKLPMRWINEEQWELETELGQGPVHYRYQLREEGTGLELTEWGEPRVIPGNGAKAMWLEDTWRSAGTLDRACQSKALRALLPRREAPEPLPQKPAANHRFTIEVAAVPPGQAICLTGDVEALGHWDTSQPLVLQEGASDLWQADVELPADQPLEYKYGLCDLATGEWLEYEQGENRRLEAHELGEGQFTRVHDELYRRHPGSNFRGAGVAVPVFSLRSEQGLGVGEFADLKAFGAWAREIGMQLVQILPIHDTTAAHNWTDSYPYSAISCFALHPIYLRLDDLSYSMPADWNRRLEQHRKILNALEVLDYEAVMGAKLELTRAVFDAHREAILKDPAYRNFLDEHQGWLLAYAAFCVLRDQHGSGDFTTWGEDASFSQAKLDALWQEDSHSRRKMEYWIWLQVELDAQLGRAVEHLHAQGVVLKGDLPIGIDRSSVEAWSAPELFHLDAQSGAPPDFFSAEGQNWGFPTYDWERMRQNGFAWWRARLGHLSRHFDAFRIDHILGFFRIWQIPIEQVNGLRGWFEPAVPVRLEEFKERGIDFDFQRFCEPWLTRKALEARFGERCQDIIDVYLQPREDGNFAFREAFDTQRKLVDHFGHPVKKEDRDLLKGLLDCHGEVLLLEAPGSDGTCFHPRFCLQRTASFEDLDPLEQERVDGLYTDYFFKRQDFHWRAGGLEKLDALRRCSEMLLCGEDLGMVPDCVPGVMRELGILSLEIQRMPKAFGAEFDDPRQAPVMSVVSPSTHDMPNLREWWEESPEQAKRLAWTDFGEAHPGDELEPEMAARLVGRQFESPAMWAIIPLQDLLAMDAHLRLPDPAAERINNPSVMPHNWCYRMHLGIEELAAAEGLNGQIRTLLEDTGRANAD